MRFDTHTGSGGGFTKQMNLSEELAEIVGTDTASRAEVVKKMWSYIKENKLQDPRNKQFIKCDEKMMNVVGVKKFRWIIQRCNFIQDLTREFFLAEVSE